MYVTISRVTGAVSGKTNYLLKGRDAGESKTAKARAVGCKIMDEDDFYNLVESSAAKISKVAPLPPQPKPTNASSVAVASVATTAA
jgi:replication factor C subunit 1